MKKYILFLLVALLAGRAGAQNNLQRTSKGTVYQLFTHNTGDRIKLNDVVTFHIIQKTDKDSLLFSTYATGQPVQAQVQPTGDLMDIFPLLTVNDSLVIVVPTDSIFKAREQQRPAFLPKGSNLLFTMKIVRVQSLAEAMTERDKAIAEQKGIIAKYQADEAANIDKYIAAHHMVLKSTASGLKYKITKPSVKRKPLAGDTVLVNYTGSTLDGKVFDSSIEAEAKKAGLNQPGREYKPYALVVGHGEVIPGWDEGLLLLNEGSKATFLIPSKLGYGEKGYGGEIQPFTSLLFNVELVKVKPIKHTPAKSTVVKSTSKTTVTKKPVVKKPAVKH